MTRIRVTTDKWRRWYGVELDAEYNEEGGWWDNGKAIFFPNEVRVLGRHEGEYDPQHWGELDPDAYDRMGYAAGEYKSKGYVRTLHGRHLLDTGVN